MVARSRKRGGRTSPAYSPSHSSASAVAEPRRKKVRVPRAVRSWPEWTKIPVNFLYLPAFPDVEETYLLFEKGGV